MSSERNLPSPQFDLSTRHSNFHLWEAGYILVHSSDPSASHPKYDIVPALDHVYLSRLSMDLH
ncbi:hypothetical protein BDZ94DRAFT_1256211 [Collybia nuda]|uniref:Uncharacterized protein n=1 Tax=Collybia nuda TaxID=64659 RepID=A0A9P5Y9H8_9AGAR|nr:hypothetical protein BDZ94DRAFT_1256211 [Collybia nuda]